jgi:rubrerythrin
MSKSECSRLKKYIKDEEEGNKTYLKEAKREKCPDCKHAYKSMAKDEKKHKGILNRIYRARCMTKPRKRK